MVRPPMPLEQLFGAIGRPVPPTKPIVLSSRCPDCWRLGRVIVKDDGGGGDNRAVLVHTQRLTREWASCIVKGLMEGLDGP